MATTYPSVASPGAIVKAIEQFRKAFPARVTAETLQKFSIAPANESYVIATFKFLGFIDDEGKKVDDAVKFFYGSPGDFSDGLATSVRQAYASLFEERGEDAWTEERAALATWFRVTDQSSELVGGRQAGTFLTLAGLAGHGEPPKTPAPSKPRNAPKKSAASAKVDSGGGAKGSANSSGAASQHAKPSGGGAENSGDGSLGLTVRVEVNLPAGGTPDVYDSIFASIRKHLIDR